MSEMIERVALAIDDVECFVRFNNWTSDRVVGSPIEVCRYGRNDEPEIVVIKRFSGAKIEDAALQEVILEQQARAAIEAMREPTEPMKDARFASLGKGGRIEWEAMIDAALEAKP